MLKKIFDSSSEELASEEFFRQWTQFEKEKHLKFSWLDLFDYHYEKPMMIAVLLNLFQQCSGYNVVTYYSATLFHNMGYSEAQSLLWSAAVAVPQWIVIIFAVEFLDVTGRKSLLLYSLIGIVVSLVVLGCSTTALFASFKVWLPLVR